MKDAETAAAPILTALINGEQFVLGRREQLALALWIAVKTIVAEYIQLSKVAIPGKDRSFVWQNKRPPSHWKIWIGRYTGTVWKPARWNHNGFSVRSAASITYQDHEVIINRDGPPDGLPCNTQTTTAVIGELFFHVASSIHRNILLGFEGLIAEKLHILWPPQRDKLFHCFHKKLDWPPNYGLEDDDVTFIATAFEKDAARMAGFPLKE